MRRDPKEYKTYLDERIRYYPSMQKMIGFYKELIDIWDKALPDDLSPLFSVERLSRGLYLLDVKKIGEIDFTNSADTARRVLSLIEEQKREDAISFTGLSIKEMVKFIKDGLSREEKFTNPILKWILKPSFDCTIEKITTILGTEFTSVPKEQRGRCPLCDSPPGMAIVDATEQRFLSCCFCGCRWLFSQVDCPACHNNRPEKFGFFVEGSGCEQGTRAVSCEECKAYIKAVFIKCRSDGRTPVDLDMDIEDVATIPLDVIANQRGYRALCQR